jgi:hypothetical protein
MQRILDRLGDRIRVGRVVLHGSPKHQFETQGIGRSSANPYAVARANEARNRGGGNSRVSSSSPRSNRDSDRGPSRRDDARTSSRGPEQRDAGRARSRGGSRR